MWNYAGKNNKSSYFTEKNGVIIEATSFFCSLIQYKLEELLGKSVVSVWHDLLRISGNPDSFDTETESFLFTRNLEVKHVNILKVKQGEIDEKKYIFSEIPNSDFELRDGIAKKLLEDNEYGIGIYTVPGYMLIKANQKYMDFLPTPFNTKDLAYGKHIWEIIHDFNEGKGDKLWRDAVNSKHSLYMKERSGFIPGAEDRYWDNVILPVEEEGRVKYLVSILNEVTDRVLSREHLAKQAEIIRLQNEQLEVIFENITDGVSLFDINGKIIKANASARKRYAAPSKINYLIDGHKIRKFYDMDGNELTYEDMPFARAKRGEKVTNQKVHVKDIWGGEYYMDFSTVALYDEKGNLSRVISCDHDITQQVEMEEEKRDALNKMIQMKDEFLSLISHEFKTPITVINSALQTMELVCRNELSDKAKGFLDKIRQNSNRQLKLVNNLLDITRMQAGRLKVNNKDMDIVELTQSITESISIYAEQKGIYLKFHSTLKNKIIGIDEEKYERILLNLLSNAIKFTLPGRSVRVRISKKIVNRKCKVAITVKDEGIGIPEDKQAVIFEKFGQVDSLLSRQSEGTGIGLSLVKMMVELMGGQISLESVEGKGSTFTVILPAEKTRETPIEKMLKEMTDNRLIQATAIEFSDIYL